MQLSDCLHQLDNKQYSAPLKVLSDNTIGKHIRHILEFVECMVVGMENGLVDYDNRRRDLALETDVNAALQLMLRLQNTIETITGDKELEMTFAHPNGKLEILKTNIYRELVYNIEHAIHHMAIIKIACNVEFTNVVLPSHFGVAYSTIQFQEQCAQ